MAFCTKCGANVTGAFCGQCGTPASATTPEAPAAGAGPVTPGVAAAPRRTSPLVWVLVIVLGIVALGVIGVVGTGLFVYHKAKQAGVDPELWSRNPGLAVGKIIAATNPGVEVVSTDEGAGTVTLRDKRDGKTVTLTFDQIKNGKFSFSARDDEGKTATVEVGENAKVPSWIPVYPGASVTPGVTARGASGDGVGEGGTFSFVTQDSPQKVTRFYEDKAKELGMKTKMTMHGDSGGGTIILADEDQERSLTVMVAGGTGGTTVNVTYGRKR